MLEAGLPVCRFFHYAATTKRERVAEVYLVRGPLRFEPQ
jgi:hypothetical protein